MPRLAPAAVLVLALAGCDDAPPPPGEVLGTFEFRAELAVDDPAACPIPSSPALLVFEAVVSYDPAVLDDGSRRFWLQIGSDLREGRLAGADFSTRAPAGGDPEARVDRTFSACRHDPDGDGEPSGDACVFRFAEWIEGALLRRVPSSPDPALDGCGEEALAACPECALEPPADGPLDPNQIGAICGTVAEDVVPPAEPCLCTQRDGAAVPVGACAIRYVLEGRPL